MTHADMPMTADEIAPLLATALSRSSHEGARIVALHWLHSLTAARAQWQLATMEAEAMGDGTTPHQGSIDALHQARVALRRLRATLHEHRDTPELREGGRIRRSLRRLGAATGAPRDHDVQRDWLVTERDHLPVDARDEADALLHTIAAGSRKDRAAVSRAFARDFDPIVARLAGRLSRYCLPHSVGREGISIPFARLLADRIDRGSAHLRHDIGMVCDVGSQKILHRIRIRLKRQRAMLAPFARTHPAIGAWYDKATEGQDLLGAMRDASVLALRAHDEHHEALVRALHDTTIAHFERFSEYWCGDADVIARLKDAAALALRSMPVTRGKRFGDLPDGHGLPMEIERKFLLHGLPPHAAMAPSHLIEQGWLPGTMLRERLRRSVSPNGDERLTRTIKLGQPGERIEVEEPTEPDLFAALWPLTANARIRKRRHVVREGSLTWEVDVFLDRDLVLAEVELDDVGQPIEIPQWLSSFIVREVTHETAYLNSVMAQRDGASPDRGSR
ncbi:MAG: CHAD domain-containing protein [Gemmatimonadaceae bacterium]|nr:CHAD domain-containing protein [Gemmatimonadaceae bacterium]